MTSRHKWLLCDPTMSVTLFFEVIIFSLGLEAVTEAICHTGHLLDKVIYFRDVIGNLSCMGLLLNFIHLCRLANLPPTYKCMCWILNTVSYSFPVLFFCHLNHVIIISFIFLYFVHVISYIDNMIYVDLGRRCNIFLSIRLLP